MRPHMAHIQNTLIKKQLSENAKNSVTSYHKYKKKATDLLNEGYSKESIIKELELEMDNIRNDRRNGDDLFQEGMRNAKVACISAIRVVISELKGEE